jgi:hypothetical protein
MLLVLKAEPGRGYQISFFVAALGLFFTPVALVAIHNAQAFSDPLRGIATPVDVSFVCPFLAIFTCRLIFWERSPPLLRDAVRALLTAVMAVTAGLGVAALVLAVALLSHIAVRGAIFVGVFATLAALCQIGSVTWLLRYRREV